MSKVFSNFEENIIRTHWHTKWTLVNFQHAVQFRNAKVFTEFYR